MEEIDQTELEFQMLQSIFTHDFKGLSFSTFSLEIWKLEKPKKMEDEKSKRAELGLEEFHKQSREILFYGDSMLVQNAGIRFKWEFIFSHKL